MVEEASREIRLIAEALRSNDPEVREAAINRLSKLRYGDPALRSILRLWSAGGSADETVAAVVQATLNEHMFFAFADTFDGILPLAEQDFRILRLLPDALSFAWGSRSFKADPTNERRLKFATDRLTAAGLKIPPQPKPPTIKSILAERDLASFADDLRAHLYERKRLSGPERVALRALLFDAEHPVGGFLQFYWNSAPSDVRMIAAALRKIGAVKSAAIVAEAAKRFGSEGIPKDLKVRRQRIDGFSKEHRARWKELDKALWATRENLVRLTRKYVLANREHFR